ncbi:MAG: hypothetical protein ABIZ04_09870 [Opitutus sp.]
MIHPFTRTAKILALTVGALAAFIAPRTYGQLGLNEAQLSARFGEPVLRSGDMAFEQGTVHKIGDRLSFRVEDLNLTVVLIGDRCVSLRYAKAGVLSDAQVRRVLEQNGGYAQWREQKTTAPRFARDWNRADQVVAIWRQSTLTLSTPAYQSARELAQNSPVNDTSAVSQL